MSRQFYLTGPFVNSIRGLTELGYEHTFISADFNTVAVDVQTFGVDANDDDGKLAALAKIAPHCKGATIIYCKSSGVAGRVARELIRLGYGQAFKSALIDWVAAEFDPEWDYTYALKHGIGLHFGGLPRALQQYTADRFNAGDIRFLLCTSTIIEGVNTVAKNVVIYDNRDGTRGIDKFTHGNIKGRAGRMGVHFVGKVFCLEDVPEDNLNQEVDVPLGVQDADTPLNMLASAQPDHLSEYSQDRFEEAFAQDHFSIELVKKHSFFKMEQFEQLYSLLEMLKEEEFESLIFHWLPSAESLKTFAKVLSRIVPSSFTRNGVQTRTTEVIVAKLASYLNAASYSDYLKSQIEYAKQRIEQGEEATLSTMLNNDLKLVTNTLGYTIPKVLGLLEDVVRLRAVKKNIRGKVDYGHLRMIFENLHLPPGVNGLEEIGIPVQTLHRIASVVEFPLEVGVDGLADYLRANFDAWKDISHVDQTFVKRALGIAQEFA
ncbi:ski2-like helicase [compost metagenome]